MNDRLRLPGPTDIQERVWQAMAPRMRDGEQIDVVVLAGSVSYAGSIPCRRLASLVEAGARNAPKLRAASTRMLLPSS